MAWQKCVVFKIVRLMAQKENSSEFIAEIGPLLTRKGARIDAAGLVALLPGIAAAPIPEAGEDWADLVAEAPDAELRARLLAERHAFESDRRAGFEGDTRSRLAALRAELKRRDLAGFLIPRADEHQGEYVPANAQRLAYISGFTGSAGLAIVLEDRAAIFVDGRYTIQVRQEVDAEIFAIRHLIAEPPETWLAQNLRAGQRIGFDPRLLTVDQAKRYGAAVAKAGAFWAALDDNPLDAVWRDRPAAPISPVRPHDLRHAGKSAAEKRAAIARKLAAEGKRAAVISAPDSLAWLLNIRGADVPRTPFALGFAILGDDAKVDLFIDERKLTAAARRHLGNEVAVRPMADFAGALRSLGKAAVAMDAATGSQWIFDRLAEAGAEIEIGECLCALPKATKNAAEIEGARKAHRRDGRAVTRFLAWLEKAAASGDLDEIAAQEKLSAIRREDANLRDLSFDSISAAGAHGAICHYKATPASNRPIPKDSIYLIDSGGQYPDGTTDITRSIAIGNPSAEMKDRFTRVLKGHIALATARFPEGTTGSQLDALARRPLWDAGLDYDHGTGHGVGSYLSVHEGPQRISKVANRTALLPGMILSNEPGYYKEGEFGIRIENLVAVQPAPDHPGMLEFETLTLAPIDLALVEKSLLREDEIAWLNAYHARVRESLASDLDAATRLWLTQATRAI